MVIIMIMVRRRGAMVTIMLPGSTCTRANRRTLRRWCSPGQNYLNTVLFIVFLLHCSLPGGSSYLYLDFLKVKEHCRDICYQVGQ